MITGCVPMGAIELPFLKQCSPPELNQRCVNQHIASGPTSRHTVGLALAVILIFLSLSTPTYVRALAINKNYVEEPRTAWKHVVGDAWTRRSGQR